MSIADAYRILDLEAAVAALLDRVAALEAAECSVCVARRALDAARQQRRRHRHVMNAAKTALEPVSSADCSVKIP